MSQRQLADALGVSQSTVARWESGAGSPSVAVMHALADLVGLRWQLVRADGSQAPGMRDDGARDRGGRRYPAHAEVHSAGWWMPRGSDTTIEGIRAWRRSREERDPLVSWRRIDHWSRVGQDPEPDHPTRQELVEHMVRVEREIAEAVRRRTSAPNPSSHPDWPGLPEQDRAGRGGPG